MGNGSWTKYASLSFIIGRLSVNILQDGSRPREVDFHEGGLSTLNCCHPLLFLVLPAFLGRAVSRAPGARRRHWGTINDYCRDYYRRSGEQAPIGTVRRSVSPGACGLVCTSGARIRATIISRISRVHAQPTHRPPLPLPIRFSSVFRSTPLFPIPLSFALFPPLPFSLSLFFYPPRLARSSLSLKYCRYEQINCTRLIRR